MRSAVNLVLFTGWENTTVANFATVEAGKNIYLFCICR